MGTCSTKHKVVLLKREGKESKGKKGCLLHYEILIFVAVLWLRSGLCVNILINSKDFLRLRLENLQFTYKFTRSFGELFYLAHSLLIPLQLLSSFEDQISPQKPTHHSVHSLPSPFACSRLYCYTMLSCHPEISPESLFPIMIIRNTNSHPDNDTTPMK